MNDNIRGLLWKIDLKIHRFKYFFISRYAIFRLKFEKDKNKRNTLMALIIGCPFSSKYDLPEPNIIEAICKIETKDKNA